MEVETLDGKKYKNKESFYCSIADEDKGEVTIGVNGEARSMYVHFPKSSDCKTSLNFYE
ncbi:hypothetical protein [Providencia alcalifaciens]|uniref:hypothetical protein n=1 Tax=Providencia alcalifaciens TaxID=126385 RepID=UPI001CC3F483|nr:hypothetical protein [Providencia alcalifaciens]CAG9423319.1 hypothetical protein NVI2019_GHJFPKLH_02266 [Providencia alcalifaciens]